MEDFNGVRDDGGFGGTINDLETAVMIEGGDDCEASAGAVVPRAAVAGFGVDDDGRAKLGDGCGVEVEVEALL